MRKTISLVVAIATLAAAGGAFAQGNRTATTRANGAAPVDQHQSFTFPDEDVSGTLEGASGAGTTVRRIRHGEGLIRFRSHFVQQMLTSVENF